MIKKKYKKAVLIVLDSVGCGALPDADSYGDLGANTILHTVKNYVGLLPNLQKCGLFNIEGLEELGGRIDRPSMSFCRLRELSKGKDTTTGHFEIAGAVVEKGYPVFPDGLPQKMLDMFTAMTGLEILGEGKAASGTEIIERLGEEHIKTGNPIVYTSADSVFQIACDENTFGLAKLYEICEKAREMLTGDYELARVIARPFVKNTSSDGENKFTRTKNRRDYSVQPPSETMLDRLSHKGFNVIGVGKISDIFGGRGITQSFHTKSNKEGIEKTIELINAPYNGLVFTNLVDFDMLYGHRRDKQGYLSALIEFDKYLLHLMKNDVMLIITADHGCDPTHQGTDHTREYVPCLIYESGKTGTDYGTKEGLFFAANLIEEYFDK